MTRWMCFGDKESLFVRKDSCLFAEWLTERLNLVRRIKEGKKKNTQRYVRWKTNHGLFDWMVLIGKFTNILKEQCELWPEACFWTQQKKKHYFISKRSWRPWKKLGKKTAIQNLAIGTLRWRKIMNKSIKKKENDSRQLLKFGHLATRILRWQWTRKNGEK